MARKSTSKGLRYRYLLSFFQIDKDFIFLRAICKRRKRREYARASIDGQPRWIKKPGNEFSLTEDSSRPVTNPNPSDLVILDNGRAIKRDNRGVGTEEGGGGG